ncbi:unnamed protein product [Soboliphyme baturini]|uniref:Protein aurora borealis n=1 Tax=Soboliphyme baturini TaxID=241478 RepID=A0A183IA69_9BILA|nr:unnamed protein product [Soboliphyme baturini]
MQLAPMQPMLTFEPDKSRHAVSLHKGVSTSHILQPTPAQCSQKPCGVASDKISYEEFECSENNPFDFAELKSLNDLEELKVVLQPGGEQSNMRHCHSIDSELSRMHAAVDSTANSDVHPASGVSRNGESDHDQSSCSVLDIAQFPKQVAIRNTYIPSLTLINSTTPVYRPVLRF